MAHPSNALTNHGGVKPAPLHRLPPKAAAGRAKWTDERIELLKELWKDGASATEIASRLGGTTRNAVIGKAHRMGFGKRDAETVLHNTRRNRPCSANSTWTPERLERLREYAAEGMSANAISRALGGVAPPAVRRKAKREGIETKKRERKAPASRTPQSQRRPDFGIAGNGSIFVKSDPDKARPWIDPLRLNARMVAASGESANPRPLVELDYCMCRFPLGGLFDPPELFCAAETEEGAPYCPDHMRIAHRPADAKKPTTEKELARSLRAYL